MMIVEYHSVVDILYLYSNEILLDEELSLEYPLASVFFGLGAAP